MSFFGALLGGGPSVSAGPSPSGSTEPDHWLTDLFGGLVTATGLRVSIRDALTVPGIAACIQVLAEDVAKVPFNLIRKRGDRREIAANHTLHGLIANRPAPWLSSFDWRRTMIHNCMSRGVGYSRARRNEAGEVERITLNQPGTVQQRWTEEGEPFFDMTVANGQRALRGLSYQDVIHLPYRGSSDLAVNGGIAGVSPLEQHREAIALAIAAERFAGRFFANGARPSAVIEMDKKIPDAATASRLRSQIERAYGGLDNSFKVAILELGMKLKETSFKNSDSQLVEIRKDAAVSFCTMFGIPPHKIGILDRATFSNIEHQGIAYVTGPVSTMARNLETSVQIACLSDAEQQEYQPELDLDDLLRGDILSRWRAYAIGRQWGWLNADEIREWESMNPLPNEAGKTYLTPLNMVPAGSDPTKDDGDGDGDASAEPPPSGAPNRS